ncbi:Hypothetical protein HDN1F_11130 [gamma proteobacterium HdN1]|nr:Hypothetical protein HDN1F_11130 [gamma proteobacterium HdN1]
MRSPVLALAWIALFSLASHAESQLPSEPIPLWQFQWAMNNSNVHQGVCVDVPADGLCNRDTIAAAEGVDMGMGAFWRKFPSGHSSGNTSGDEGNAVRAPILIGMIDTGIDYLHPDLEHHVWLNPREALGQDLDHNGIDDGCEDGVDGDQNGYLDDCHGINVLVNANLEDGSLNPEAGNPMDSDLAHGTNMAGLMVADAGDGSGIRGIAGDANVRVVTCKAAQLEPILATLPGTLAPALTQERMRRCVDYFIGLRERGERLAIINASGGMSASVHVNHLLFLSVKEEYLLTPEIFEPLLNQLSELNILVVAAAGNLAWDMDSKFSQRAYFPAAFSANNVLSVGAINAQGALWSGSTYGRYSVDVSAPGHQILSTVPSVRTESSELEARYTVASGTSPATALVSGLAALILATPEYEHLSAAELRRLIMASGMPLDSLSEKTLSGRVARVVDDNGTGALSCANQTIQRRVFPQANNIRLLPGDTLHVEVESFQCEHITQGEVFLTRDDGETLFLNDAGIAGDRVSGDGIFSGEWLVPETADVQVKWSMSQGNALPEDVLTVTTAILVDNKSANTSSKGIWLPSILRAGYWGTGYEVAYPSNVERTFSWVAEAPRSGHYELVMRWPDFSGFASNASLKFKTVDQGVVQLTLDQRVGGEWVTLGEYFFEEGENKITISNKGADGAVVADAIRLVWVSE